MNIEAWDADATHPPVALPDALADADYSSPSPLARGNEPGEVAILIEIDVFSG